MTNMQLIRFYLALLALFTIGRWGLSLGGAEYGKTHHVFSIVILTFLSSLFYGWVVRGFAGGGIKRAFVVGLLLGAVSQVVVFSSTAISYLAGMDTFFNYPTALNVEEAIPFGKAMGARAVTALINTVFNGILAALGYGIATMTGPKAGE